ncbi:MAG: TetR/AcrR family transcriptional regulator [Bacteroidetes bacterium]|nr:TetR/AcrR family transcriptional regulator [Bacteroidota bacterium]
MDVVKVVLKGDKKQNKLFNHKTFPLFLCVHLFLEMGKREEIMLNATPVFMRYGIKSVSMDDLAKELSISKKTIYQHFKDKNDLIESMIHFRLAEDQKTCCEIRENALNAIDSLNGMISMVTENMGNIHPSVFYDLQKYHPAAHEIIVNHKNNFVLEFIKNNISRGIQEGYYRSDFDDEIIANLYVRMTDFVVAGNMMVNGERDFKTIYHEVIAFMIHGLISEKGREYTQSKNDKNA